MKFKFKVWLCVLAVGLFTGNVIAHQHSKPLNLDQLMTAFGWDFDKTEIKTEKVTNNLYVLFGVGGNVAVNVGDDGVLIVDDQFPQMMPKIKKAIKDLGHESIDFAITTHWHFDHAEGNLTLGEEGTWLVAHENSRDMMQKDNLVDLAVVAYQQDAYPESAWPDITFRNDMQFHLNGQSIDLMHFGPAHTTGDAAVYFKGDNAVHMGDVFNMAGYPFIDAHNGGGLNGVIEFCSRVLQQINQQTKIIPGHGPVVGYKEMVDYRDMLIVIRDRLQKLIDEGASLEQVKAANITAEYDAVRGDNTILLDRAYLSLKNQITE